MSMIAQECPGVHGGTGLFGGGSQPGYEIGPIIVIFDDRLFFNAADHYVV
jgi:hypothetical protein